MYGEGLEQCLSMSQIELFLGKPCNSEINLKEPTALLFTVSTSAPDQQTTEITGFTQANSSATEQTPEIFPTSSATKEDGKHQTSNDENAENGNVRLIIAVITSSIVAAGVVAVPLVCFFRRR